MELLFVWIEKYNNIHHLGFNFSPKHKFKFEPTKFDKNRCVKAGMLYPLETENNYPINFFGNHISNITAIIGQNGSGKSSLIEFILSIHSNTKDTNNISKHNYIIITKDEGDNITYYSSKNLSKRITDKNNKIIKCTSTIENIYKSNDYNNFLYNSPHFNSNINNTNKDIIDLSTSHIIKNILQDKNCKKDLIFFHLYEMERQISLVKELKTKKETENIISFKLPDEINITIEFHIQNNIKHELSKNETLTKNDIEKYIYCTLATKLDKNINISKYDILRNKINTSVPNASETINTYSSLLDKAKHKHIEIKSKTNKETKYKTTFTFEVNDFPIYLIDKQIKKANPQFTEVDKTLHVISPKFTWHNISDGESLYLSIFSRIFNIYKLNNRVPQTWILDEPDIGMHPHWQKYFLFNLINFAKLIHSKSRMSDKIKIIITTHSPIILSDFIRDNIIFIDKDLKGNCIIKNPEDIKETFAANIHDLYMSSFFMNDGLMGHFAKSKLEELINTLSNTTDDYKETSTEKKDNIQFTINKIGEPIIKKILQQKFNSKYYKDEIDCKIKQLELELEKLKLKKHDSN